MKENFRRTIIWVVPVAAISLLIFTGIALSQADNSDRSKVIYYVG